MNSEFHSYKVGDVAILNANTSKKDPKYYIVKVVKVRKATTSFKKGVTSIVPQKYVVEYADGDTSEIERTLEDIRNEDYEDLVGFVIPGKARKSAFGKDKLPSYLLVEQEVAAPTAPMGSPKPPAEKARQDEDEEFDAVIRKPATTSFSKKDLTPPKKVLVRNNSHTTWRVVHDVNAQEIAIRGKKGFDWIPKRNILDIKEASADDLERDSLERVAGDIHATTIADRRESWRKS